MYYVPLHYCAHLPNGLTKKYVVMAETLRRTGDVIRSRNPLGRIGTTDDVAGACLFLASRAGAYVNGATITLDGGETCRMDGFDGWSPSSKL
jgi:NAD(P)-dependent dehydrogenase (short-subunit alcohol dehydrogenase family)